MKYIFGILVYQALCFLLESRNGAVRPPFHQVSVFVEQPSYKNKTLLGIVNFPAVLLSWRRGGGGGEKVVEGE